MMQRGNQKLHSRIILGVSRPDDDSRRPPRRTSSRAEERSCAAVHEGARHRLVVAHGPGRACLPARRGRASQSARSHRRVLPLRAGGDEGILFDRRDLTRGGTGVHDPAVTRAAARRADPGRAAVLPQALPGLGSADRQHPQHHPALPVAADHVSPRQVRAERAGGVDRRRHRVHDHRLPAVPGRRRYDQSDLARPRGPRLQAEAHRLHDAVLLGTAAHGSLVHDEQVAAAQPAAAHALQARHRVRHRADHHPLRRVHDALLARAGYAREVQRSGGGCGRDHGTVLTRAFRLRHLRRLSVQGPLQSDLRRGRVGSRLPDRHRSHVGGHPPRRRDQLRLPESLRRSAREGAADRRRAAVRSLLRDPRSARDRPPLRSARGRAVFVSAGGAVRNHGRADAARALQARGRKARQIDRRRLRRLRPRLRSGSDQRRGNRRAGGRLDSRGSRTGSR